MNTLGPWASINRRRVARDARRRREEREKADRAFARYLEAGSPGNFQDWWSSHPRAGTMARFESPYDQYRERNGQTIEIVRRIEEADAEHDEEVLPMFIVRFEDGEEIEAWPEEIH